MGSKRARQRGSEAPTETARKRPQKAEARRPNRAAGRGFGRASRNATFPSLRSAQSVVGEGRESGLSKTRHGILIALGLLRNGKESTPERARERERRGKRKNGRRQARQGARTRGDSKRPKQRRARRLGGAPAKSDGIEERPLDACASPASATGQRDAVAGRDTRARRERWGNGRATASSRQREGAMRYCVRHLGGPGQAQYPDRHNIRRDANCWSAWFHWDSTNRELIRSVLVRRLQMRIG